MVTAVKRLPSGNPIKIQQAVQKLLTGKNASAVCEILATPPVTSENG